MCDGIPQCNDGSDEAVELECHKSRLNSATKTVAAAVVASATTVNNKKTAENSKIDLTPFNHQAKQMTPYGDASGTKTSDDWPGLKQNPLNFYAYPHTANEDMATLYPKGVPNSQTGVDYNNYAPSNWNPFNAGGNDLANTKTSEKIMTPNFEQDRFNKESPSLYWPPLSFSSGEQQQQKSAQESSRPILSRPFDVGYNIPSLSYENRGMANYPLFSKSNPAAGFSNNYPSESMPLPIINNNNNNNLNDKKKTDYSHISASHSKVEQGKGNVMAVSVLHDVTNQNGRETNSAVIALTLGLFITSILILLVGCRMKTFKKRLARRGRSLAHDSDYLVNGMHL